MDINDLRVLIIAEHASLKFGGEAALPLHYFRVLRKRGIPTWLIVHERTREELESLFPSDLDYVYFVSDTFWHRFLWDCSQFLPQKLADFTFSLIRRLITQIVQRHLAQKIVQEQKINIIHQPILVSPKEPSMIFDMNVPVIMGPMNGGMKYPPAFRYLESRLVNLSIVIGRLFANLFNILIPGKLKATSLLVANQRTKAALPKGIHGKIIEIVENGVDLSIWKPKLPNQHWEFKKNSGKEIEISHLKSQSRQKIKFVFVGRLVNWKAVDLLIQAFKLVSQQIPAKLEIIGDGDERPTLEALAQELGLMEPEKSELQSQTTVNFTGFLAQVDCAQRLQLADIMVLPSLYECGGAVVLEAMTMGIPVIATHWGGPEDYLDESCGILVKPTARDSFIKDLAKAMLKMSNSSELRQAMGKAGRQRILKHFDWEVKIDTILEIYLEAINRYRIENSEKNRKG